MFIKTPKEVWIQNVVDVAPPKEILSLFDVVVSFNGTFLFGKASWVMELDLR